MARDFEGAGSTGADSSAAGAGVVFGWDLSTRKQMYKIIVQNEKKLVLWSLLLKLKIDFLILLSLPAVVGLLLALQIETTVYIK